MAAKRSKRGSVNNSKRLHSFASARRTADADWAGATPDLLAAVVVNISLLGGAATFGLARDGGAHMLTLMLGKERETLWYNADIDLDEALREVLGMIEAMES